MIAGKKILCVITARAGSQGLPGKNYQNLMGKPLFIWSVLASLKSQYVDKTIISSNCENVFKEYHNLYMNGDSNIIDFFENKKISFIDRPEDISGPLSKNEEALIHAIYKVKDMFNEEFDVIINLQPTSPCRLGNLLDKCIEAYHEGGHDSLLTASKDTPFIWQRKRGKWEYTIDSNDCCDRKMRQEFNEDEFVYHDNGNIYIVDSTVLKETGCRIGSNHGIFETDKLNSLQIDTDLDFDLVENMLISRNIDSLIT